jgi:two-component system, NarL family, response regulator NreC
VYPPTQIAREPVFAEEKIRCILVHDHVLLRQGLRRLLQDEPDIEVIAEAGDAVEAWREVFAHRPEVVIADIDTFGLAAGDTERLIRRESPHTQVLFLSRQAGPETGLEERQSELAGCAVKQTGVEELVAMVRESCRQARSRPRDIPTRGGDDYMPRQESSPGKRVLTAREREVVKLLAEGRTVRSAADVLGVSAKTVDAHKFNLMRKLGIHNKAELVMWAVQTKVVKVSA